MGHRLIGLKALGKINNFMPYHV